PGSCHTNDYRLTPAAMRALECCTHHVHIADALKRMIHTPAGHLHDHLLDGLIEILRVNAFGSAKLFGQGELRRIRVDADDTTGLRLLRTLHHGQTNTAKTEHGHRVTFLHLGGVLHGTKARSHTTAEQANLL